MLSVIIPTLNAEKYLPKLIEVLQQQRGISYHLLIEEMEIIIVDSESEDNTIKVAKEKGVKVLSVPRADFDHGGTRNIAWKEAKGEYIFFLTQDALPASEDYLNSFLEFFEQNSDDLVMISARQIPYKNARITEQLTRAFNYPDKSNIRDKSDIPTLGIKAFFFSDAGAVYRRSFLEEMNGFENPILTNEDMLMAARALKKGYKVGYCSKAEVYHSHNFSLKQQYKRNFDVSAFLTMYKDEVFSDSVTGEGVRMVRYLESELLKHFHFCSMIYCVFESAAKYLGNRAGRKYREMSLEQILKRTSNPTFWRKNGV